MRQIYDKLAGMVFDRTRVDTSVEIKRAAFFTILSFSFIMGIWGMVCIVSAVLQNGGQEVFSAFLKSVGI